VKAINDGVRSTLGFTGDMFADRPGFIAGGGGNWPLADAVRQVSQFNCRQWARSDKSGFSAAVNTGNSTLCNPYLQSIGMLPPEGDMAPEYKGGQCPGVAYGARYTWRAAAGAAGTDYTPASGQFVPGSRTLYGPLTYLGWRAVGAGSTICGNPGQGSFEVAGFSATGVPQVWGLNQGGATCRPGDPVIEGLSFERIDGQSECGNPEPLYTPPGTPASDPGDGPNITVNIPGIGPTTVTVNPGPDGNPIVCYEEVGLCVEIPIGDGGVGAGDGGSPPGPPVAGTPGSTGDGGEDEGDAPEGKELWALRIDINSTPLGARPYAPGVYRAVCYVYMGDENGLDHDPAGSMLRSGQLVFAERDGLTKYRVAANIGFNLTVTPYWRTPEEQT
jgi:hypothetical protein